MTPLESQMLASLDAAIAGATAIGDSGFAATLTAERAAIAAKLATPPAPAPSGLHHPLESVSPTTPEAIRFLAYVDSLLPKPASETVEAFPAALAYKITGNVKYAQWAASRANAIASWAEAQVGRGIKPDVANDSYLGAGDCAKNVVYPLAWCREFLTADQITRCESFARQLVTNIKTGGTNDVWYGKQFPDSTWAVNNPNNNYHYSFLMANVCWALYSGDQAWLDYARKDRLAKVLIAMGNMPEGGSYEGTGYGISHWRLFEAYGIWKASTGEDVAALNSHCRRSLAYWVQATTPGGKFMAPIGDQSRISSAPVYDYLRALMLWATWLNSDSTEAPWGRRWLLDNYPKAVDSYSLYHDMLPISGIRLPLLAPSHLARAPGHFFARSDSTGNATFLSAVCGGHYEGHQHQEHGSFNLWHLGGWAAVKANNYSASGILQGSHYENQLFFSIPDVSGPVPVPQLHGRAAIASATDDGTTLIINMDMTPLYVGAKVRIGGVDRIVNGLIWKRRLTYTRPATVLIEDDYTLPAGVSVANHVFVTGTPTLTGNVVETSRLKLTVELPAAPNVTLTQASKLGNTDLSGAAGLWRVGIYDSTNSGKFRTRIEGK